MRSRLKLKKRVQVVALQLVVSQVASFTAFANAIGIQLKIIGSAKTSIT